MNESPGESPAMSLWGRLLNVIATPGDVFESIKSRPPAVSNWLVPLLLSCAMCIVFSLAVFSQENVLRGMRKAQEKELQQQVKAGKMTQEQANQAIDGMEKFMTPTLMKIFGSLGGMAFSVGFMFFVALVLWLMDLLIFKAHLGYVRVLEIAGLASVISALGAIIKMLLVIVTGDINMSAGPALLIDKFDPKIRLHALAAAFDLTMVWYLAVLAIGFAVLAKTSVAKPAACLFGIWIAIILAIIGISSALGWVH